MFCAGCGSQVDPAQGFCSKCGNRLGAGQGAAAAPAMAPFAQQVVVIKAQKNPGIAAVLSFFWAGLGQIYNGEIGKGVLLLIVYVVSCVMMIIVIGFITTPILWIYGMIDAYKTAEKINANP